MFYCLVTSRPLKNDDVRDELMATAYTMLLANKSRRKLKSKTCDGYVKTAWKRETLVHITGIIFHAEFECDEGKFKISYFLRDTNLAEIGAAEHGAWLERHELGEEISPTRVRPNPLHKASRDHRSN